RAEALRSLAFWSVAGPFGLGPVGPGGFFLHQNPFLDPARCRTHGRVTLGLLYPQARRWRPGAWRSPFLPVPPPVIPLSLVSQAAALFAMTQTTNAAALFIACAIFGLSAGNLVSLPAMIIQREFEAASFGMVVGLSTAVGQFTYAFGPGLLGAVRDATGGY